jgi:predicted DCC family thiol-disulfide oxidoreductase YuxK
MASADTPAPPDGTMAELARGPVLLFDGECGVCAASVQWVLAHERQADLRFAALQSPVGRSLFAASGLSARIDSLVWLETTGSTLRAHYYADAVRAVLHYVGGPWLALHTLLGLVPRPLRDLGYRWFARHRLSVAAKQCLIPTPMQKARFFEQPTKPGLG